MKEDDNNVEGLSPNSTGDDNPGGGNSGGNGGNSGSGNNNGNSGGSAGSDTTHIKENRPKPLDPPPAGWPGTGKGK